ncbi:MAG: hypothetical protein QM368_05310 [Bacillota bacterium]|jgi:TusA-related sulfurtransferase|nr:hypothetical protein [Bacillota bacterium]HHU29555.1 hypothetical protein [Bacillota bacterium]
MKETTLDCRNMECPKPVAETKRKPESAVSADNDVFRVTIYNKENEYQLKDSLQVGEITNMYSIVEKMFSQRTIII